MADIKDFSFFGFTVPGTGIEDKDGNISTIFSVCLNINKLSENLINTDSSGALLDSKSIQKRYQKFYNDILSLENYLGSITEFNMEISGIKNPVIGKGAKHPFEFFNKGKSTTFDTKNLAVIKDTIWNDIFLSIKAKTNAVKINGNSSAYRQSVTKIEDLLSASDLNYLSNFRLSRNDHQKTVKVLEPPSINQLLTKVNQFAKHNEEKASREKIAFIRTYGHAHIDLLKKSKTITSSDTKEILNLYNKTITSYYKGLLVDIDELVHSFNAITNDPALMRLMGFIRDIEVIIPKDLVPKQGVDTTFTIRPDLSSPLIHFPATKISGIYRANKYAFLVGMDPTKEVFYQNSILNSTEAELIRFDKVSKIQGINHYKERVEKGEQPEKDDNIDALTRSISYTHKKWKDIAKPVNDITLTTVLTDEYLSSGHRVSVQISDNGKTSPLYSLTGRSISLNKKGEKPFFYTANNEGCIHTDMAVGYYENGEAKYKVSDTLFEYSGELLTLKSAFSKGQKLDKVSQNSHKYLNHHDSGLSKSEGRFNGKVTFFYYPFTKKQDEGLVNCYYNIPAVYNANFAPKLRFGKSYRFALSQHYLGGGGLPIFKQSTKQLSVEDLIQLQSGALSPALEFNPVENKKPIVLVARKQTVEDENAPFSNKNSIEHVALKSTSISFITKDNVGVHAIPAKMPVEHAFWYGKLSPEILSSDQSFILKRQANCSFSSEADYLEKKKQGKICSEDCTFYCGGMHLKSHYPEEQIQPRIFADPTVKGFNLRLYWDEECELPVDIQKPNDIASIDFDTSGVFPSSVLISLWGSKENNKVDIYNKTRLDISLKIGSTVYAKLQNNLDDKEKTLFKGWWTDLEDSRKANLDLVQLSNKLAKSSDDLKLLKEVESTRNAPKKITLTHASKVPLVAPIILSFASIQYEHRMSNHIEAIWLKKPAFQQYQFGKNIIANRIDKVTGNPLKESTYTKVDLKAHFERLDAIKKIEFLRNVTPTGGLEIWMRKEEYIDDPTQIAINSSTNSSSHKPDEPVVKFSSRNNTFILEHKIEFDVQTMAQLKDLGNASIKDNESNAYLAIISQLKLEYDFRTTKFEEREYYLKNSSKFKGFFTDQKLKNDANGTAIEKLEDYVLPKLNTVYDAGSPFRFKVIVLNNKQPTKPEVAYAVTTIMEEREILSDTHTISKQSGNSVTIYLKRGRLKSGKGERVALFVDASSVYHELLLKNDLLSKAGKDILTDRYANRNHLLQAGDIIIPNGTDNEYQAAFEPELGLYHFLPKFDYEKQLWKFEIQLKVHTANNTELHNPFINFSLAHYQPFSINYNLKTTGLSLDDLKNDCRLSDIEDATWCYLLPERKLSVFFNKPGTSYGLGTVKATLSFDHTSLNQFNKALNEWKLRTNFIMTVQGQKDEEKVIWHNIKSQVNPDDNELAGKWKYHHPLINDQILATKENIAQLNIRFDKWDDPENQDSEKYKRFRVKFVEVEWFVDTPEKNDLGPNEDAIIDNDNMRTRYIELIY
jgi:hypothetical protein